MKIGETWLCEGLWESEPPSVVRIMELLSTGMIDVNYELDPRRPSDCRILPYICLLEPASVPILLEHLSSLSLDGEPDLHRSDDESSSATETAQQGDSGRGESDV